MRLQDDGEGSGLGCRTEDSGLGLGFRLRRRCRRRRRRRRRVIRVRVHNCPYYGLSDDDRTVVPRHWENVRRLCFLWECFLMVVVCFSCVRVRVCVKGSFWT